MNIGKSSVSGLPEGAGSSPAVLDHHLVKLWFDHPTREYGWFVATHDPETVIRATIEALSYRCHPNAEFQKGFDRLVTVSGQLAFPAYTPSHLLTGLLVWVKSPVDTPTPFIEEYAHLLHQFAAERIQHEERDSGTYEAMHSRISSIVWLVGKSKGRTAPIVCNAITHDDTAPAAHAGQIDLEWVYDHPIHAVREDKLLTVIDQCRQRVIQMVEPYEALVPSMSVRQDYPVAHNKGYSQDDIPHFDVDGFTYRYVLFDDQNRQGT